MVKLKSLEKGKTYSFKYPNFSDGLDYRRLLVESVTSRDGRILIEGVDLDNGNDAKWYVDRMQDVQPTSPVVIPRRAYRCKWRREHLAFLCWSCYPKEDGGFRVTGTSSGNSVAFDLDEITCVEAI